MSPGIGPTAIRVSLTILMATAGSLCANVLSAQQVVQKVRPAMRVRVSPDLISSEQLRAHPDLPTAYLVVQALHSNWMLERGVRPQPARKLPDGARSVAGENGGVQTYLDGHRLGGPELLKNIPSASVYSIRHLSGIEAQARFGVGHSEGVIWIATSPAWGTAK